LRNWRKVLWPSELRDAVREVLAKGDMTLRDLIAELRRSYKIAIQPQALSAILLSTAGIYVCDQVLSPAGKLVNVYTVGIGIYTARRMARAMQGRD